MTRFEFEPIGIVHSPFRDRFGIPRQPGLVPGVPGTLELLPPFDRPEAVAGLEGYSHIWVQFVFHQALDGGWQPTVRPPRLGGNRKVGVFAIRSPFRPNPIGLSLLRLEEVETGGNGVRLHLSGIDLLDGTPVLDIKPYLPYVESVPDARGGYAPVAPAARLPVRFSPRATRQLGERPDAERVAQLIRELLALDPRPAYRRDEEPDRVYGFRLYDFDLRWRVTRAGVEVLELHLL